MSIQTLIFSAMMYSISIAPANAQSIRIIGTSSPLLDGTYQAARNWQPAVAKDFVARVFIKKTGTITYAIYQVSTENDTQWLLEDNLGNTYFTANTDTPYPKQLRHGWDIGPAGIGLNKYFTIDVELPAESPAIDLNRLQEEQSILAEKPVR